MDDYLFKFVLDEMRLHFLQNPAIVSAWQQTLCHLISFMLLHGMPMERLDPRPDFYTENKQARNSEEALLVVLNACARLTRQASKISWPVRNAFGTWISRLQGQRMGLEPFCLNYLSFLELQNCALHIKDLYGANLEATNLMCSGNVFVNLQGSNLRGANLQAADFEGAILRGADLHGANLRGAILQEAVFQGANLRGAILQGVNSQMAVLQGADFEGAILEEAVFWGANLEGANLRGAVLRWANFEGANLRGADFEGAILEGANFKGADLKGTILEDKI